MKMDEMMSFKDKVYIISGSASGIGKSCSEMLIQSEAIVIGIDKQESSEVSPLYTHYQVDITNENDIENVVNEVVEKFGRIDGNSKPFYEIETADWENVLSVNLSGLFVLSKYVSRVMIPQKHGKIVNISCIRSSIFRNKYI